MFVGFEFILSPKTYALHLPIKLRGKGRLIGLARHCPKKGVLPN